ncbi:Uncharacterised protein [Vibrio cholerae]|nr:Uncharacterised protein [Vibrio cholerae]
MCKKWSIGLLSFGMPNRANCNLFKFRQVLDKSRVIHL